jgi:DNA-binding MarR family transcriptional regulator
MERITASLHELVYAMDGHADRVLGRYGLDQNLFAFLAPLAGDPLDVTGLARALHLSKAAVSKRVPLLVRDGWLDTSADPRQRRRVVLALTPHATGVVAAAAQDLDARFADVVQTAGVDAASFHSQVRSLVDAVRALPDPIASEVSA